MPHHRGVGKVAEDRAAAFLRGKGFTLLTRRFKAKRGELDLVALDRETIVFIEVKMRAHSADLPEEALSELKRKRLALAAEEYLANYEGPERQVRFDVIAIDAKGIRHYEEAFWP